MLARPVVSVGNLSVGGTGKTPVVAALAARLVAMGERPAILSRGYRRTEDAAGVVVVSDGTRVLAPVSCAGDEPLMLARAVRGAVVCVSPDRYLSGLLAERVLGATVHLLDDGFQHVRLARDLDVLVTSPGEIPDGRVLPMGRLREPMDAAARAGLLVVMGATADAAASEARMLGIRLACGAVRRLGVPQPVFVPAPALGAGDRVVTACGVAHPQRFVRDLLAEGWSIAESVTFPDHHPYTPADLARLSAVLARTGAMAILTTDKDAVRFEAAGVTPFPLFRVPMAIDFEPSGLLFEAVGEAIARHCPDRDSRAGLSSSGEAHP